MDVKKIEGWDAMTSQEKIAAWKQARRSRVQDAARRRKLGKVAGGVDVAAAFAAYRKRAPFSGNLGHVTLTVGHRVDSRWSGHAKMYSRKIRVAYGPDVHAAEVLEILVHEMVHLACPRGEHHGERFRRTLRRAAQELWGIAVPLDPAPTDRDRNVIAYAMDRLIIAALREKVDRGEVETFPAQPAPAPLPRAERNAALVERRAKNAIARLAVAERKAKAAQRTLSKWRRKVAYYERVAARRS